MAQRSQYGAKTELWSSPSLCAILLKIFNLIISAVMDPILYLGFLVALLLPSFTAANGPCTKDNLIALTFDDGPYEYENIISSYLHNLNIKATFFVNGCNYGCIYDEANVRRLRKTFEQGNLIASHSYLVASSHHAVEQGALVDTITILSDTPSTANTNRLVTLRAHSEILGIKPKFFRAPYGEISDENREVLKSRGYEVVGWTADSEDSLGASVAESLNIYTELAQKRYQSQIILNHETYETTANKLVPAAVRILQSNGYRLVHVSECLGIGTDNSTMYQSVGPYGTRDVRHNFA
ncbi:hypothetical protein VP01_2040g2 [Puccinia sorghi]|uniref:NodB homology domain-containing protein n=1 Tax=Puccinia sorghi TaxID=27349 RepID=A0A0L6VAV1_9BASI|nr:hypothetical protein VP01_2040g2 [Puccinia sorghi]